MSSRGKKSMGRGTRPSSQTSQSDQYPGLPDRTGEGPRSQSSAWPTPSASAQRPPQQTFANVSQHEGTSFGSGSRGSSYSTRVFPSTSSSSSSVHLESRSSDSATARESHRGRSEQGQPRELLRTRPDNVARKQGQGGQPVQLTANYFELKTRPDWALYQYRVDIAPEEERTFVKKAIIYRQKARIGGYMFDGTMLFCSHRLTPDPLLLVDKHTLKDGTEKTSNITIKFTRELHTADYAYLQVLSILMRRCWETLDLKLMNRNYFDPNAKISIPQYKLELWPGYLTSLRQHENKILMCAEIKHKVMRTDTVLDMICETISKAQQKGFDWKKDFERVILGAIVVTRYNHKSYKVCGVDYSRDPRSTFSIKSKGEKSYTDYMKEKYNITIRDLKQPLLVSKLSDRDIRAGMGPTLDLIPELCFMTGYTEQMRTNFSLMSALAVHTHVKPEQRQRSLINFINRLRTNSECASLLSNWNMSLSNDLVRINGRRYEEQEVYLSQQKRVACFDWTQMIQKSMYSCSVLRRWLLVSPRYQVTAAGRYLEALKRVGKDMGFIIPDPTWFETPGDRPADYARAISGELNKNTFDLVMCIVNGKKGDVYSAIKKACFLDRTVPSQVLTSRLCEKAALSTATKVAIQLNAKLGGVPWTVNIPLNNLMIAGYDVSHDTVNKSLSVGAMVATLDKAMSKYFSSASIHGNGEELSNHLAISMNLAVKRYADINKTLPTSIIIYRDGVGEGQIPYVKEHEVCQVKRQLDSVYPDAIGYKLTFIIVTKRINTRIFLGARENPKPGTVVDDVITDPMKYDFFLVSQSCNQGTVSPTSYNVIENGVALPPERLQLLTYRLTHMYFNCSYTMSVPAVCQLAHKLALLVSQNLHRVPDSNILGDSLYFL